MCRPKHRNDYNHGKNGFVGGNPRYSKKDRRNNRVELVVEEPDTDLYYHLLEMEEFYFNAEFGCYDFDDDIHLDHDFDDDIHLDHDFDDDIHLDHDFDDLEDFSCFEDDDLPVEPMLMSFGRNSIEEGGMFYEGYWS